MIEFVSKAEFAAIAGVSRPTVSQWLREGKIAGRSAMPALEAAAAARSGRYTLADDARQEIGRAVAGWRKR